MTVQSIEINQNWEWKQRDKSVPSALEELHAKGGDDSDDAQGLRWRAVTAFPSEVHVELLKAGMIPDPYIEFNEHKVQCASLSSHRDVRLGWTRERWRSNFVIGVFGTRGRNGGMVVQDNVQCGEG